jgi:hypothetical protein
VSTSTPRSPYPGRALTDLELPLPPLLDLLPKLLFHRLILLQQAHEPALGSLDLLLLSLVLGELVERLDLVLVGRGELTGRGDQLVGLSGGGAVGCRVQTGLPGFFPGQDMLAGRPIGGSSVPLE